MNKEELYKVATEDLCCFEGGNFESPEEVREYFSRESVEDMCGKIEDLSDEDLKDMAELIVEETF